MASVTWGITGRGYGVGIGPFAPPRATAPTPRPSNETEGSITGDGIVVRFSPIRGITPTSALARNIYLPALLNNLLIDETALHNEYDTLSAGKFSQPAMGPPDARQLRTGSLDSLTVDFDASWLVVTGQDPVDLRNDLYEILRARKPVHVLAFFNPNPYPDPEVDMDVTFRDISRELRAGENESRYLTIAISEWRDPSTDRRSSMPTSASSRKPGVTLPTTDTLEASDTLASLAYEFSGRYSGWRAIRDANGITKRFGQDTPIVSLGGRWHVGAKIKIPANGWEVTGKGFGVAA